MLLTLKHTPSDTIVGEYLQSRMGFRHRLLPYELARERRVRGGRPGPPGCQGRLPLRSLINVRRFRK